MRVIFRQTNYPFDEPRTDHDEISIAGVQDVAFWCNGSAERLVLTFNKQVDASAAYDRLGSASTPDCCGAPYRVFITATRWGTYVIEGKHYNVLEITRRRR